MDEKKLLELEDKLGKAGYWLNHLTRTAEGPEKMMLAYVLANVSDAYKLTKTELVRTREAEQV